jgi:DNA mismatch repair protein MutS2
MAITSEKRKAHSATFKVGDQVRIKNHEGTGTLLHIKGKKAQVVFGSLTSFVQLDRLEKISGAAGSTTQKKRRIGGLDLTQRQEHFNRALDVRGKRPEEVLAILDAFMDDAIVLGNANLKIIHGKGHGVLREVIRTHLKTYRNIETMQDEHVDRGGSGITLINLK